MKITSKRRKFGSIINNKKDLERYAIHQTVILHCTGIAIQEGILKKEPGNSHLIAPAVHWQCVLTDMPEGPGVVTVPDDKGFHVVA